MDGGFSKSWRSFFGGHIGFIQGDTGICKSQKSGLLWDVRRLRIIIYWRIRVPSISGNSQIRRPGISQDRGLAGQAHILQIVLASCLGFDFAGFQGDVPEEIVC